MLHCRHDPIPHAFRSRLQKPQLLWRKAGKNTRLQLLPTEVKFSCVSRSYLYDVSISYVIQKIEFTDKSVMIIFTTKGSSRWRMVSIHPGFGKKKHVLFYFKLFKRKGCCGLTTDWCNEGDILLLDVLCFHCSVTIENIPSVQFVRFRSSRDTG